jgi:hypothetical protein
VSRAEEQKGAKGQAWWNTSVILVRQEMEVGEFTVLGQPGRKLKTLPTAKQSQKDGDMAQGVCVPTKHEALSSIPETAPKRRRK